MMAAFLKSLRDASRNWPWAAAWTGVSFVLSALAIVPLHLFIRQVNGASLISDRLLAPGLDAGWLIAAWHSGGFGSFRNRFVFALVLVGLTYLLINIYLTGGMIGLFRSDQDRDAKRQSFFDECRQYVFPLLGATLVSAVAYGFVAFAFLLTAALIFSFDAKATNATAVYPLEWAAIAGLAFVLTVVGCVFDYVKVGIVLRGERNPFRALWSALQLTARRPIATFGLYWLTCVAWILIAGGATLGALALPQSGWLSIIAVFFVQQIALFLRGWLRLAFFAGECHTYALFSPPAEPSKIQILEN